jgi:hypothetical protein
LDDVGVFGLEVAHAVVPTAPVEAADIDDQGIAVPVAVRRAHPSVDLAFAELAHVDGPIRRGIFVGERDVFVALHDVERERQVIRARDAREADWQPQDGAIGLQEWLAFGVKRVPELYEALRRGNAEEFRNAGRGINLPERNQDYVDPSLQTPALFDFVVLNKRGVQLQ